MSRNDTDADVISALWIWWLLTIVLSNLLAPSHAGCSAGYYGNGCKRRCNCTSQVNGHECACESIGGYCDQMCMSGEVEPDIGRPSKASSAAILGGGASVFVLIAFGLFLCRREHWNKKKAGPIHRTTACTRVSNVEPPPPSELLVYDVSVDYGKTMRLLQEVSAADSFHPLHLTAEVYHDVDTGEKGVARKQLVTLESDDRSSGNEKMNSTSEGRPVPDEAHRESSSSDGDGGRLTPTAGTEPLPSSSHCVDQQSGARSEEDQNVPKMEPEPKMKKESSSTDVQPAQVLTST